MSNSGLKMKSAFTAVFLAAATAAMPAAQAEVIYNFGSGGLINGTGFTPVTTLFATASFTDVASSGNTAGYVKLVMNVFNNLPIGAYVNEWAFNLLGTSAISSASFMSGQSATFSNVNDGVNLPGVRGFDFGFNFSTSDHDLANGESSTYRLVGTNLTAASFLAATLPGHVAAAVKVQGYNDNSAEYQQINYRVNTTTNVVTEIVVPMPEPSSIALFGLGILGLAMLRRRSVSKNV